MSDLENRIDMALQSYGHHSSRFHINNSEALTKSIIAMVKADEWIAVGERLPERWEACIVVHKGTVVQSLVTWNGEGWDVGFTDDKYDYPVSHWLPLPNPPTITYKK